MGAESTVTSFAFSAHPAAETRESGVFISKETELVLHPPRVRGIYDHIRSLLKDQGIEILAVSPYSETQSHQLLLVVHEGERARAALLRAGIHCQSGDVLLIRAPWRMDLFPLIGERLRAAGIRIQYTYLSMANNDQMAGVFKTSDEYRALETLTESFLPLTTMNPRRQES